ncbi:MAG TPA: DUF58 domain-containing protein, partial [Thermoleophilia bacterium]|nr:DUF58 domain-containing protein [Thermoleophilia bacterium]
PPTAGLPVSMSVTVDNRTVAPTTPARLHMDLRAAAGADLYVEIGSLAPRQRLTKTVVIPTLTRGVYSLATPRLETVDPLGLARRRRPVGDDTALTVFPWIASLDSCVFFGGRGHGQDPRTRASLAHASFDLRGVRPHQPGEPLSRIDWKSTAKTGTLMLRETEEHTRSAVVLVLDGTEPSQAGGPGEDTFELSVSVLGSIGAYLLREGIAVRLLAHAAHPEELSLEPGERGMRAMLATLARVRPGGDQPLSSSLRAFRSSIAAGISVVVATPSLDRALVIALTSLVDHGTPTYLLHVDTAAFREEHEFLARDKRMTLLGLQARGVPSLTIHPGDDLTSVLSVAPAEPVAASRRGMFGP